MLKHRESEFCRLTAALGNPREAARRAGYKEPNEAWPELIVRADIADEIHRVATQISKVFRDTMICGVYRMMSGGNSDAVKLLYRDDISDREIEELNLSGVAEMKRTDKGVELKLFDRLRALDKLSELSETVSGGHSSGGLLEAMLLSAKALRESAGDERDGL